MLGRLSPARRRFVLAVAALLVAAFVTAIVASVASRPDEVTPVSQETPGPVLLVPGYGGSTAALDVLAAALRADGRDVTVVAAEGDGTEDLRTQAEALDRAARTALDGSGAESVDVVGYSAGGIVARVWVADLGGDALARRVVTLASPNHGTDLASVASGLGSTACPEACQQLATDSDLLRELNADDETPDGPQWVAIWTADDKTVVPPDSGVLDGATTFSVQEVCADLVVAHADAPRSPSVMAMVASELGRDDPSVPDDSVCVNG
jgi:triacylglycerol esterase/lipase EstA (alpha/beta hydrolase family)